MNKKFLKSMALVCCAILLVVCSIVGTFAYLTSTANVTNTFTVGKVKITLDESKLNADGITVDPSEKVLTQTYHLMPGITYQKDPTVHVEVGSEKCWVFIKIVNNIDAIDLANDPAIANDGSIEDQLETNGWTQLTGETGVYYKADVDATTEAKDLRVFSTVTIQNTVDNNTLKDFSDKTIDITAYAVQAAGISEVDKAWDAVKDLG
jgi:predicted ribosomally synthesized peptide with SipW-like signal peptide